MVGSVNYLSHRGWNMIGSKAVEYDHSLDLGAGDDPVLGSDEGALENDAARGVLVHDVHDWSLMMYLH